MSFDYWSAVQRIQRLVIDYPWHAYGNTKLEAYYTWEKCLQHARRDQLQMLGVESIASWKSDPTKDYDATMQERLVNAVHNYLNEYAKRRLPEGAYKELRSKIET